MTKKKNGYVGVVRWRGYSFPYNIIEFIKFIPEFIYDFCRRGWSGWTPTDTWSLDYYLSKMIPNAISHLRSNSYGSPMEMDDWTDIVEDREIIWASILTAINDGFEANNILMDSPWLEDAPNVEFKFKLKIMGGSDPVKVLDTESDPFFLWLDEHREEHKSIEKELEQKRDFGLSLFVEFFPCLWD